MTLILPSLQAAIKNLSSINNKLEHGLLMSIYFKTFLCLKSQTLSWGSSMATNKIVLLNKIIYLIT